MSENRKVISTNRKARHDYELLDTIEAGLVLTGSEIKSIRAGHVNLREGYIQPRDGELWLVTPTLLPMIRRGGTDMIRCARASCCCTARDRENSRPRAGRADHCPHAALPGAGGPKSRLRLRVASASMTSARRCAGATASARSRRSARSRLAATMTSHAGPERLPGTIREINDLPHAQKCLLRDADPRVGLRAARYRSLRSRWGATRSALPLSGWQQLR